VKKTVGEANLLTHKRAVKTRARHDGQISLEERNTPDVLFDGTEVHNDARDPPLQSMQR
jgi:hypothetical protein